MLQLEGGPALCGAYAISEYLAEGPPGDPDEEPEPLRCFPATARQRAEVRRLVDWFNGKFNREVTQELLHEKVYARLQPGAGADARRRHPARHPHQPALPYELREPSGHQRRWLAGDELTFADLAAAAHLSSVDYLGEVPWEEFAVAKVWYARLKSRRAFRAILADRVPGALPPAHYADLDF